MQLQTLTAPVSAGLRITLNRTRLRRREKVFAIGFNKSGTSSLHALFKSLGLSSYHGVEWRTCQDDDLLQSYDCFSDDIPADLPKLDRMFPGAKFILQVRELAPGETVGYGATWRARRASRIGVLGVGYRDGFPRALSRPLSKTPAQVYIAGHFAPIVGRISMDLMTIDLTGVPPESARRGARVELLGDHVTVNDVARWAGTIPYEILTGLGSRFARLYASSDHPGAMRTVEWGQLLQKRHTSDG